MHAKLKVVASIVAVLLGMPPPFMDVGNGQVERANVPARSSRGGALVRTARYQFEVFCYRTGLRVFVSDPSGSAMSASTLKGTARFYHPNSPHPWFTRALHPAPAQPGHPAESLDLALDLSTVPTSGATVAIEINGLPDSKDPGAQFTLPFAPVEDAPGSSYAGQGVIPMQGDTVLATQVHYFATSGFYRTASGALIWIPARGYYYDTPVQYYPHVPSFDGSRWQPAHPAPSPNRAITAQSTGAPDTIQTEYYWRPRAWGNTEEYRAWLRGQMRLEQAAGRSPSMMGAECAKCHRR